MVAVGFAIVLQGERKSISPTTLQLHLCLSQPSAAGDRDLLGSKPHLCMASRRQGLVTLLTSQAGPVPVLPQRSHLLGCHGKEVG